MLKLECTQGEEAMLCVAHNSMDTFEQFAFSQLKVGIWYIVYCSRPVTTDHSRLVTAVNQCKVVAGTYELPRALRRS